MVLVVDQHAAERNETLQQLRRFGVPVLGAGDLAELKAHAGSSDVACVVTDWQFHTLNGSDLIPHLKPDERPVFLFSRRSAELTPAAWEGLGLRRAVAKPRHPELLRSVFSHLAGGPQARKANVLIIDDSATVRLHLRKLVQDELPGSEVLEAEDGRTGLRQFGQHRVDLALVDLNMPGMDGATFLRTLHGNPLLRRKPLLVLSSSITPELRAEWADDDLVRFLGKDAPNDELILEMLALIAAGRRRPTPGLSGAEK
jgi:two-component system chemotaxis response regulator CheY